MIYNRKHLSNSAKLKILILVDKKTELSGLIKFVKDFRKKVPIQDNASTIVYYKIITSHYYILNPYFHGISFSYPLLTSSYKERKRIDTEDQSFLRKIANQITKKMKIKSIFGHSIKNVADQIIANQEYSPDLILIGGKSRNFWARLFDKTDAEVFLEVFKAPIIVIPRFYN